MVKMEKRNGQPLFKVKWLCVANCIAAGHLALGYCYLVVAREKAVAGRLPVVYNFFMAGYVQRCRERPLKYGKLMVGGQTHIFAEGSTGLVCIGKRRGTTF
jgi:hypothetical protein